MNLKKSIQWNLQNVKWIIEISPMKNTSNKYIYIWFDETKSTSKNISNEYEISRLFKDSKSNSIYSIHWSLIPWKLITLKKISEKKCFHIL